MLAPGPVRFRNMWAVKTARKAEKNRKERDLMQDSRKVPISRKWLCKNQDDLAHFRKEAKVDSGRQRGNT